MAQTEYEQETEQRPEAAPNEPPETPADAGVSGSGDLDEQAFVDLFESHEGEPEPKGDPEQPAPEPAPDPAPEDEPQEPAQKPQKEQEPGQEPEQGPQFEKANRPPEVAQEPEWFQKLSDEEKTQVQQEVGQLQGYAHNLYQSYQALHGRLAPVQRENEDLRKRLHGQEQQTPPTLEDLEKNDAWKEIAQEFPKEAESVKQVFTSQARALQQVQDRQQQAETGMQRFRQQFLARESQRLNQVMPDAQHLVQSPRFHQWREAIRANPQQFPDIAEALRSPHYEENAYAIDQFKRHWAEAFPDEFRQVYPEPQQQPPAEQPPPPQQPQEGQQPPSGQPVQGQQRTPQRPKPPNPSPPSQGSGVSGTSGGGGAPMTNEEYFVSLFD